MRSIHEAALMSIPETPGGQRCRDTGKNLPAPIHEPASPGTAVLATSLPGATDPRRD